MPDVEPAEQREFQITWPDGRSSKIQGPKAPTEPELQAMYKALPPKGPNDTKPLTFGKGTSIHAPTFTERLLEVTEWFPYVGGGGGGIGAGIPGAFLGATIGKSAQIVANTALTGRLPAERGSFAGQRAPAESKTGAFVREGARSAADVIGTGVTAGALPEMGGRALQMGLSGGFLKPVAGTTDAKLYALDRALNLRMTAGEVSASTPAGMVASTVEQIGQRSFFGQLVGKVNQRVGRLNTIKTITEGGAALKRVGAELEGVIKQGPTVDMLPEKLAAVKIANSEIFPKVLQLKGQSIPKPMQAQLMIAMRGGLSPQQTHRLLRQLHPILAGKGQAVPVGSVDTLLRVLDATDDLTFEAATNLRTGMMEVGGKGDVLLGERGTALSREYTKQLTAKLEQLSPEWRELTTAYRRGMEGVRAKGAAKTTGGLSLTEKEATGAATRAGGQRPFQKARDFSSIENVREINEAIQRRRKLPWPRLYEAFELASVAGATYKGGPAAGAYTAMTLEALPSMIVWASYNQGMKRYLIQGFTAPNLKVAAANLMRVAQGYRAWQKTHEANDRGGDQATSEGFGDLPEWAK